MQMLPLPFWEKLLPSKEGSETFVSIQATACTDRTGRERERERKRQIQDCKKSTSRIKEEMNSESN